MWVAHRVAGDDIIWRSIELKQPVIYAAMNYRLGGTSYPPLPRFTPDCLVVVSAQLGGKEVKKARVGNLSLQDRESVSAQYLFACSPTVHRAQGASVDQEVSRSSVATPTESLCEYQLLSVRSSITLLTIA